MGILNSERERTRARNLDTTATHSWDSQAVKIVSEIIHTLPPGYVNITTALILSIYIPDYHCNTIISIQFAFCYYVIYIKSFQDKIYIFFFGGAPNTCLLERGPPNTCLLER